MTRRRIVAAISFTALLIALAAAYLLLGSPYLLERRARAAVSAYDLALQEAYANADPSKLADVASDDEIESVSNHIGIFELKGTRLEARLLELDVTAVEPEGDGARVTARERWSYRETDVATGEPTAEPTVQEITITYVLVARDGQLVVGDSLIDDAADEGVAP